MPDSSDKKTIGSSDSTLQSASALLKSKYKHFVQQAADLFPKVDQKLLMNILQFEIAYDAASTCANS